MLLKVYFKGAPWGKLFTSKTLLIMKFAAAILLSACLTASATGHSQKVSLSGENVPLAKMFSAIETQTNYVFFYSYALLNDAKTVSIEVNNVSLQDALKLLFKEQPLDFVIKQQTVFITKKNVVPEIKEEFSLPPPPITIKGLVVNEMGEPLAGASVKIKDTEIGTTTDANGSFSISANINTTLVISYVGHTPIEVVAQKQDLGKLTLKLAGSSVSEQIVVIGYGSVKRKDLTGSVVSVRAADMVKSTDMSLNATLQGRAAGVSVVSNEGAPGADVSVYIRAGSSISARNEPLYVIDGFPSIGSSNLNINVNDVESVEILKDASATAIYGSRGANGVIIITTKSGKPGKFSVNYDAYYAIQKIAVKRSVINTLQYAEKQHYISASPRNSETGDTLWHNWRDYKDSLDTDWQDEVYRLAPMQSHNLSFTGGTTDLKVSGSVNLTDQDGIAVATNYKRFSARLNTIANISKRIANSTTISLSYQDRTGSSLTGSGGLAYSAVKASPFRPPGVNLNQYLLLAGGTGGTQGSDPLVDLQNPDIKSLNYFASLNTSFTIKLLEGLSLKLAGGLNYSNDADDYFYPSVTSAGALSNGIGEKDNSVYIGLLNENTLNYTKAIGDKNKLDAVVGFTAQTNSRTFTETGSSDFAIQALGYNNLSFGSQYGAPGSGKSESGILSYFGRVNYSFLDKYLFTGSIRADGSSKFPVHKWGYFPSGAFAWKVDEERFMQSVTAISTLKLRISLGATGNESISPYSTYTSYGSVRPRAVSYGREAVGVYPNQLGSPDLKWETTIQKNVAVDIGLVKNHILLTAEAYMKTSKDLLLRAPLSLYSGFNEVTRNVGDMEVKGMEFDLNTVNLNGKFKWNTNFNIAFNKTKVLSLNENQQILYVGEVGRFETPYIVQVGKSLGSMFGYVYDGIINTQEELSTTVSHNSMSVDVGTRKYKDISGPDGKPDGVVDANDRTIIGNGNPAFFGGFTNDFSYGSFELSFLFTYSYGNDVLNADKALIESPGRYQGGLTTMFNRWTPENPQANKQRWDLNYNAEGANLTSFLIEDGSYLRLKNLQIAYNVKTSLLTRLPFKSIRAYVSAQNLLTFTRYTGYDPEVNYLNSIITPGADLGAYPRSRIYTVGLNVAF